MEGSLTIDLFGPIRVLVDGEPMPRVRSRKALWLLALLALRNGRPATREWVADALWPDAEGGQGLANLRPLISELRSALGSQSGRLLVNDRTVALDVEGATVDAVEFDEAFRQGDFARAAELYRGELLEGCSEEWAVQEQRVRETNCLTALQALGDTALSDDRPAAAVDIFTRAIGIDGLRDAPRRGLMAALAAMGDVNAALQSYREFARLLSAEVSTVPDKETTGLYEQLRADLRRPRRHSAKPTPNNLVQPLSPLVGREDEGADVEDLLRRNRLVTLTGVGGIGKTRLAASVASATLAEYYGGVWLIRLDALGDSRAVTGAAAAELGVQDTLTRPLVEGIVERLREGRCLLVLDNCEHLLDAAAELVVRLLHDCPNLHILATSRETMNIPGELVWPVPPLAFPLEANLPEGRATRKRVAEGYESVRLFVDRARAVQPAFELNDENLAWVIDVCAQVDGLPLAIELAAARTRSLSIETLTKRLREHHLETLQGRGRGLNERQQALRATIDWSYALLEDEDRRMMAQLAVFAGGWTLEAAEQVCGAKDAMYQLHSLVDKSIVVFDDRTGRYRFLETVRQYAEEKLAEGGEADQVRARHRAWCMDFAKQAQFGIRGQDQAEWLRLADREWPNLKKALDQGDEEPNFALRLAGAVWYYWYIRSTRENYRYLEETLARDGADDPSARAEVLLGLGAIRYSDGDHESARIALDESLAIFQSIGDKEGIGRTYMVMGNLASVCESYEQAMDYYEKSLGVLRQVDDRFTIALTLSNLAMQASQHDDFARAEIYYEEGLKVAREISSDRLLAMLLMGYANMVQRRGNDPSRKVLEQEALELFEKLGDKRGSAQCLMQQGAGDRNQGAAALAMPKLEESRRLYHEIGDRRNEAYTGTFLASAAMDSGDLITAESVVRQTLETMRELDDRPGIAEALYVFSMVLRAKGDWSQSWVCMIESLNIWVEIDDRSGVAATLDLVGEHAANLCADEEAAYFFGAAEALRETLGVPRHEVDEPAYQRHRSEARTRLGDLRFDEIARAGRETPVAEVVARTKELTGFTAL